MNSFKRLSVGAKLGFAFLLVLSITAFLGWMSIIQLGRVNDTASAMAENWVPAMRAAQSASHLSTRYRTREFRLVLSAPVERGAIIESLATMSKGVDEQLNLYEKMSHSKKGAAQLQEVRKRWREYFDHSKSLQASSRTGDEENTRALLLVSGLTKYSALEKALEELAQINSADIAEANQLGDNIYATSLWQAIAMTASSIVLGGGLALGITRLITRPLAEAVALAQAVEHGDLTKKLAVNGEDEVAKLQLALLGMVERLKTVISQVRDGVDSVSGASAQIAAGNQDLSARTEQAASNLEETASSMEQLTSAVSQSADTARQASQLASSAAASAARGGEVVGQVVARMAQISDSSNRIADIISVIDSIAFQTNILALNASVEAARAGEQGRGFAVVASEVRVLAQRAADAAKDIKGLINRSAETVEAGSLEAAQAGETMGEIVASVRKVTDLMSEIAAAAIEQRDGIGQVNQAVTTLDQMTQQNAALVEESTAASASLRDQATQLAAVVSIFKVN